MSLEINGGNIRQSPVPNKKDKKSKSVVPTIRFELSLTESNDNSCPEFSYKELHRDIIKKNKDKDDGMKDLAAIEEDKEKDEAEALAKYYEHKYGAATGDGKKRKRDRIKDLVDVGYGYDENDPFVDDSEVYDEIVPSSLTTQHGGFYINMGKLEFKQFTDDEQEGSDSDDSLPLVHHKPQKRKKSSNPLSSDDSADTSIMLVKKKKKHLSKDGTKIRRKLSINGKESKLNHCTKSTMAKKLIAKAKAQQLMNSNNISGGFKNEERKVSHEKSTAKSKLESVVDKDLAAAAKNVTKNVVNIGPTSNQSEADKAKRMNDESTSECKELPPNLPDQLTTNIKTLTQIAKTSEGEGKQKFFSSNVNNILLDIESNSQQLSNRVRNGMYQHLAHHLPCSKDTLMKRAKKLHAGVQDEIMKQPLLKLKGAIEVEMEDQLKHYQQEVLDHQARLVLEGKTTEKMFAAASTDEDDEESKNKQDAGATDKKRKPSGPRKKFKWSENIRSLLVEVVKVKIKQFESTKLRGTQSYEELLKTFLDTTVKPLWPKPWMQTRFLLRESRSAHEHLTQAANTNKPKKAGNVSKKSIPVPKPEKKPQPQVNANSFADLIRQSIIGDTSKAELDIKKAIHAQVITSNNTPTPSGEGKRRIDLTKTVVSKVNEPVKILPDGKSNNKIHCDTTEVKTKTISVTPRLKIEEPKPKQPVINASMNKMPQLNPKALSDFSSGMSDEWFMQLLKNQQMHSASTADSSIFQSLYPIKMNTQPKQMSAKPTQVKTMSKNFHSISPESSQSLKRTEKSPQGTDRIIKKIPINEKKSNTFKPVSSSPIMNNPLRHVNYSSPSFINNWEAKLQQPKVISSSSSLKTVTKNFAGSSLMNKHSNISQSSSQSSRNVVNNSTQLTLRKPGMSSSMDEFRASVTKPSTAAYGAMLTTPKHPSQKPGHSLSALSHKQTHSLYQGKTTPEKNQPIPIHSLHAPSFPPNHSLFSPSIQYLPQVPHQKELLNSLSVQSQLHSASTNPNSFGILPPNMQYTSGLMQQFPQVYLHDIAEQMRTSSSQSENGKR